MRANQYNKLFENWKRYTGKRRGLLLEAESNIYIELNPRDFLKLTTTPEDMERISKTPSITAAYDPVKAGTLSLAIELDDYGYAKVREHEGRNRSWKAIQAGLDKVPVQLMVLNRKASINDIKSIEAQFSQATVNRSAFTEKTLQVAATDPLGIGAGKDFKGYHIMIDWATVEGIQGYINDRYNKEPAFHKDGKTPFLENILNKYYRAIDNTGQEYTFANSPNFRVDDSGQLAHTGLLSINLKPHPLTLVTPPNMEEINNRTYTILRR